MLNISLDAIVCDVIFVSGLKWVKVCGALVDSYGSPVKVSK